MGGFAHDASPFFLPSRVGLSAKKLCGGADPILYRGRPCRSWVIYYTCMIASVSGTIQAKGDRFLIVETGGIGYRVFVTPTLLAEIAQGSAVTLFTHHHVAETIQELYGFLREAEVEFFRLLLSISNVGPKTALNVMSVATLDELKSAIQHGDPTLLTK